MPFFLQKIFEILCNDLDSSNPISALQYKCSFFLLKIILLVSIKTRSRKSSRTSRFSTSVRYTYLHNFKLKTRPFDLTYPASLIQKNPEFSTKIWRRHIIGTVHLQEGQVRLRRRNLKYPLLFVGFSNINDPIRRWTQLAHAFKEKR